MNQYTVFVQNADGTGKIVLSIGNDPVLASELAGALVAAASSVTFDVGVEITQVPTQPGTPPTTATPARAARR